MTKEIWKDIQGYEGLYQISNLGRIKSLERMIITSNNITKKISEKILKPCLRKNGYYSIVLQKNNKSKYYTIHRLVAKEFIPNPNNLPQVNHKDGNKLNNNINNLEWCTNSDNTQHGYDNKLYKYKSRCHAINVLCGCCLDMMRCKSRVNKVRHQIISLASCVNE